MQPDFSNDRQRSCWILFALLLLAFFGIFMVLHFAATVIPSENTLRHLSEAFEQGELQFDDWPTFDTRIGNNQYNDCAVFQTTILINDDPLRAAISPNIIWSWPHDDRWGYGKCLVLHRLVNDPPDDLSVHLTPYHRYLHGNRVAAAFLLPFMNVRFMRITLTLACYGLVITALALSAIAWHRAHVADENAGEQVFHGCMFLVSLAFVLFYGLQYYAMSISHGPSEIVLFCFLITALRVDLLRVPTSTFIVAIVAFGSLTIFFEFLTGYIPLGLALLIVAIGLRVQAFSEWRLMMLRVGMGAGVFLGTMMGLMALKHIVAAIVFGAETVFGEFLRKLRERTVGVQREDKYVSLHDALEGLLHDASIIAYGSDALGRSILMFALASLFAGTSVLLLSGTRKTHRLRLIAIFASLIAIFAWLAVFKAHALEHSRFMVRMLVWPIAASFAIAYIAVLSLRDRRSRERSTGSG